MSGSGWARVYGENGTRWAVLDHECLGTLNDGMGERLGTLRHLGWGRARAEGSR